MTIRNKIETTSRDLRALTTDEVAEVAGGFVGRFPSGKPSYFSMHEVFNANRSYAVVKPNPIVN